MEKNDVVVREGGSLASKSAADICIYSPENASAYLKKNRDKIEEACGGSLNPTNVIRACYSLLADPANTKKGALFQCSKPSFLAALMECLAMGISPMAKRAYFVPYKNEESGEFVCKLTISYLGLLEMAMRAGISAKAQAVFEGDEFSWEAGTEEKLVHIPNLSAERTPETFVAAYVISSFNGIKTIEVMTRSEIEAVRERSKSKDKGPWKTDFVEMAKKTVVRRASKYWPMSQFSLNKDRD